MGKITLLQRIREFIGHLGWKVFIWGEFRGNEETFQNQRDEDAFRYYNVELPKTLRDKLYPPKPE